MSELLQNIQTNFQQYVVPCLTGIAFALIVLLGVLLFFSRFWSACRPRRGSLEWISRRESPSAPFRLPCHPLTRGDGLPLVLITLVYAATAFFRLGSLSNPQSTLDLAVGQAVTVELSQTARLTGLSYYSGLGTGGYNVEISADGATWYTLWDRKDEEGKVTGCYWADAADYPPSYALPQGYNDLFKWLTVEPENPQNVRFLRITGRGDKGLLELGELALYSAGGGSRDPRGLLQVSPAAVTGREGGEPTGILATGGEPLFDEQDTIPQQNDWSYSAYFDEIYHARTALEHIKGVYPYEVSHPPLGKLIIGLGIRLFGMTPFGWRFMGTLFGVLMVPALYVFLKNLFGKTPVAACGAILFAFDFMHLTQTRIATIDTYGVFFILLMYYFLYRYLALPAGTPFRTCAPPLLLSGLCWGLGAASKWTVLYAGAGMALAYFLDLFFRLRDWPAENPGKFLWLGKLLAFSVLCFVVLPIGIYCASYLPYAQAKGDASLKGLLDVALENQKFMFTYHEGVTATHPYSSRWFQWMVDARPILYYLDNTSQAGAGLKAAFGCFSNPVVCWSGLLAIVTLLLQPAIALLERLLRPVGTLLARLLPGKKVLREEGLLLPYLRLDGRGIFILIGYFSQLVPWMFIGRTTFAYHYFPSTLFLVLAVAWVMDRLMELRPKGWKLPVYGLTAGAAGLYALFYPVLVGLMVPVWYTSTFLKWMPSWPF